MTFAAKFDSCKNGVKDCLTINKWLTDPTYMQKSLSPIISSI